jgi:hypothetical protein
MELVFGKYKGRSIDDPEVPKAYLEWLYERNVETAEDLKGELGRREQAETENTSWAERLVRSGFRTLANEYKGDEAAQKDIAGARAILEGILTDYFEEHAPQDQVVERQRKYAQQILNDANADEDDREWAGRIMETFPAEPRKAKTAKR